MDQPGDVAQTRGRLNERMHGLARGRVDRRDARFVSGVPQDLCHLIGVLLAHVGQQDMLTDANPARNRLTDLPGPMTTITSLKAIPFRERFASRDAWKALNYLSLGWGYAL